MGKWYSLYSGVYVTVYIKGMGNIVTLVEKITPHHNRMKCRMVARRRNQWLRYVQGETEIEHMEKMEFVAEIENLIKEEQNDIS